MKNDFCALSFLIFLSLLVLPAGAANIKVMTQNQYLGADLTPLFAATDDAAFNAALVTALQTVAANRPVERMRALADDIAKERPALVGLQEVYQFQCTGPGCSDPSIAAAFVDYLQLTVDALDGTYQAVASVVNLNIPGNLPIPGIPFQINGADAVLSVVDRDVILARSDIEAIPVDYTVFQGVGVCLKSSGDGCNYSLVPEAPTPPARPKVAPFLATHRRRPGRRPRRACAPSAPGGPPTRTDLAAARSDRGDSPPRSGCRPSRVLLFGVSTAIGQ